MKLTDKATGITEQDQPAKKAYHTPQVTELGKFSELTKGAGGSSNDGVGGGSGLAGSFRN